MFCSCMARKILKVRASALTAGLKDVSLPSYMYDAMILIGVYYYSVFVMYQYGLIM